MPYLACWIPLSRLGRLRSDEHNYLRCAVMGCRRSPISQRGFPGVVALLVPFLMHPDASLPRREEEDHGHFQILLNALEKLMSFQLTVGLRPASFHSPPIFLYKCFIRA